MIGFDDKLQVIGRPAHVLEIGCAGRKVAALTLRAVLQAMQELAEILQLLSALTHQAPVFALYSL